MNLRVLEKILPALNRYYVLITDHQNYQSDAMKSSNFIMALETRCSITVDVMLYLFGTERSELNKKNITDEDSILDLIDELGYVCFSFSGYSNGDFPGHIFIILKYGDKYVMIESFIMKMYPQVRIFSRNEVECVIDLYATFSVSRNMDVWKLLTRNDSSDPWFNYNILYPSEPLQEVDLQERILKFIQDTAEYTKNENSVIIREELNKIYNMTLRN